MKSNLREYALAAVLTAAALGMLFQHSKSTRPQLGSVAPQTALTPLPGSLAPVSGASGTSAVRPVSTAAELQPEPISTTGLSATLGRVTKITDGDTLHAVFLERNAPVEHTIRLFGIDTPESNPRPGMRKEDFKIQPYALEAKAYLGNLLPVGSPIKIEPHDKDRYGRTLAVVFNKKGDDVNAMLLDAGMARTYFLRAQKKDPLIVPMIEKYTAVENRAKSRKSNIWSQP